MLDALRHDARHALRGLLRDRIFTAVALLSIGLGVGANSAVFSLVDQALFRRLPVREPEKLVLLSWNGNSLAYGWGSGNLLSNPMFRQLKAENDVFEGVFARHPSSALLTLEGTPEAVNTEIVSGSYFPVLGVGAALGRVFDDSDDVTAEGHPVAVLSHDFWKSRLGGSPDVLGRKVLLNNYPMTIVGVAAEGFRGVDFGELPALFIPVMMKRHATDFDWLDDHRGRWLHIFGRLKPGVSRVEAAARLQPWFKAMLDADMKLPGWPKASQEQVDKYLASTLDVLPAASGRSDLRRRLEQPLLVLLAATGLVLLLACLNVANLSLARAFARRRDTALRLAVGARPRRIVGELLLQSGMLATAGAVAGVVLAPLVTRSLVSFLPDAVDLSTSVNPRVFAFALLVALTTGVLFGLVPALQAGRTSPGLALKEEARGATAGLGLRRALVVGQITLALVLLAGAGLFVRTLGNLRGMGPGFSTTNLLMFGVNTRQSGYSQADGRRAMTEILRAVRELPEVAQAGIATATLLGGGSWNQEVTIEADRRIVGDHAVHIAAITPGFFATLGTAIVEGRDFDERDVRTAAPFEFRSAIVNERFVKRYFGEKSPLGARLALSTLADAKPTIEIVGVVRSFSYRSLRDDDDELFMPFLEADIQGASYYVRTRLASGAAFASIRAAAAKATPGVALTELRTLDNQLDRSLTNERLLALLASTFAGLAVLLAAVGLFGVTSFVVSRRTREIGIRMALGATPRAALLLVVHDTAVLLVGGLLLALPTVFALGRFLESQLYGVHAMDTETLAEAAALVTLAAFTAAALPARRATRLNPVEALRYE